jgi:hypothetical protein
MIFKRIDGIFTYDQLDDDAKENVFYELENDPDYIAFISQELQKRFKNKFTQDDKWQLFDLSTSDELLRLYCEKNDLQFTADGELRTNILEQYKKYQDDPYNKFD